jgi:hypothetical protein
MTRWATRILLCLLLGLPTVASSNPLQSKTEKPFSSWQLAQGAKKQCSVICQNKSKKEWTCQSNETCCGNAITCTGTCNINPFACN